MGGSLLLLLGLVFLLGAGASFIVPLVGAMAPDYASSVFGLYFLGTLVGEGAVFSIRALTRWPLSLTLAQSLLAVSYGIMACLAAPQNVLLGRALEGLAGGASLPLFYGRVLSVPSPISVEQRIPLVNSVFAVGYVCGPLIAQAFASDRAPQTILWGFSGMTMILLGLFHLGRAEGPASAAPTTGSQDASKAPSLRDVVGPASVPTSDGVQVFLLHFVCKVFFGFCLPHLSSGTSDLPHEWALPWVVLSLSGVYILGQWVGGFLVNRVPEAFLGTTAPLALGALLAVYCLGGGWLAFFGAALVHSITNLLAIRLTALRAESARTIAYYNLLSDAGLVVGSLLSVVGLRGTGILSILCLLPWLRFVLSPAETFRAETVCPFLGAPSVAKTLRKQVLLRDNREDFLAAPSYPLVYGAHLRSAPAAPRHDSVSLVFGGDLMPTARGVRLDPEVRAFLRDHDLRLVNLETPLVENGAPPGTGLFFSLPRGELETLLYGNSKNDPAFNVLTYVNNHAFDQGVAGYERTRQWASSMPGTRLATSELCTVQLPNLRVGVFASGFGCNAFWSGHPTALFEKPETVVSRPKESRLLRKLQEVKGSVDLLILSYHWGYEAEYYPSTLQKECWEVLRENGVDILFGHHSHLVQPFHIHPSGRGLCLYSCGNLCSDMDHPAYREGALISVRGHRQDTRFCLTSVETRFLRYAPPRLAFAESPTHAERWLQAAHRHSQARTSR